MKPGEKNLKILKDVMNSFNIKELSSFSIKEDGWFFILEVPCETLPLIKTKDIKNIPKRIISSSLNRIYQVCPELANEEIEIPKNFKTSLRYDFVLFKVYNHSIEKYKTFEIQGDGHYSPYCFGLSNFVSTILSDIIKEENGTIMIPFYKGINKEKFLSDIISQEIS